jgi:hypothetical protein
VGPDVRGSPYRGRLPPDTPNSARTAAELRTTQRLNAGRPRYASGAVDRESLSPSASLLRLEDNLATNGNLWYSDQGGVNLAAQR